MSSANKHVRSTVHSDVRKINKNSQGLKIMSIIVKIMDIVVGVISMTYSIAIALIASKSERPV